MRDQTKQIILFLGKIIAGFCLLGITTSVFAAGDIEKGKALAQTCAACHAADGNSAVNAWPKIAGQNEKYVVKELLEFQKGQKGKRYNAVMLENTKNLSKQDIENLAAYYASLKMSQGVADPKLVDVGQRIYRGGNTQSGVPACMACHSPDGRGNAQAGFPVLAGQNSEYVVTQLLSFANGSRSDSTADIMRDVSKKMTTDEIHAVADYIAGLY